MPQTSPTAVPDPAWKAVGSPSRRASLVEASQSSFRLRAMSNPNPFGDGPPPGLNKDWQEMWPPAVTIIEPTQDPDAVQYRKALMTISSETDDFPLTNQLSRTDLLYEPPKNRLRSKSSSAIFTLPTEEDEIPAMPSIWNNSVASPQMHRRSSTQPQESVWGAMPDTHTPLYPPSRPAFAPPSPFKTSDPRLMHPTQKVSPRRHSLATSHFERSAAPSKQIHMDSLEQLETIDDYFENTQTRRKSFLDATTNLGRANDLPWPLYVVEFKAGRTDYFFYDGKPAPNVGELVIVEADRGKDLGKVLRNQLENMQDLAEFQATHVDPLVDSHNGADKQIVPKRIHRLAQPGEVTLLLQKHQDENRAMALCQTKIRQKKLPMEIVDAEYQWDRRKLTFYFVADRRIDFRELVRELFKIYKTRIWM